MPSIQRLSLGWCAFTGVMLLLLISEYDRILFHEFLHYFCTKTISCNLDAILQRVEWITLIFFGAMFITMECLARLGLIKWIGKQTEEIILLVDKDYRLALAIIIVLWVS